MFFAPSLKASLCGNLSGQICKKRPGRPELELTKRVTFLAYRQQKSFCTPQVRAVKSNIYHLTSNAGLDPGQAGVEVLLHGQGHRVDADHQEQQRCKEQPGCHPPPWLQSPFHILVNGSLTEDRVELRSFRWRSRRPGRLITPAGPNRQHHTTSRSRWTPEMIHHFHLFLSILQIYWFYCIEFNSQFA